MDATWKEIIIAKRSLMLSKREINNVRLENRDFYISVPKAEVFLQSLKKDVAVDKKSIISGTLGKAVGQVTGTIETSRKINLSHEVKRTIKEAERKKLIVPYEKCRKGQYILVHMPFYNGKLELKSLKDYPNVYWWYGVYRDLTIYACGNCTNIVDGINGTMDAKALWDPSGSHAAKELFDRIDNYVIKETENIDELLDTQQLSCLKEMIHYGTMRGRTTEHSYEWYDMLMRCDAIENVNGDIKIFGSPVFVTYGTVCGYGWYYIGEDTKWTYYQEKRNEKDRKHIMKVGQIEEKTVTVNSRMYKKIPDGIAYGYWKEQSSGKNKIHFSKRVQCTSNQNIDKSHNIIQNGREYSMIKAACITTAIIEKKIHYFRN